ncbi:MAG TPA: efflux RND transporter periplasmic adaptor subunit, partial [Catalimonadaceae bacterium]|nr:efflux RND transporter periplasmic adaptor subunit [Catalimonadaceae bacterium]
MDRVIEKKKWTLRKIGLAVLVVILVFFIGFGYWQTTGKSRLNVDTERITISEIKNGPFMEYIPVSGTIQPKTSIFLDALEGGRVEEKLVEDGAVLTKGQPILRLSNTDL